MIHIFHYINIASSFICIGELRQQSALVYFAHRNSGMIHLHYMAAHSSSTTSGSEDALLASARLCASALASPVHPSKSRHTHLARVVGRFGERRFLSLALVCARSLDTSAGCKHVQLASNLYVACVCV